MADVIEYRGGTDPIHRDDPVTHEAVIPVLGIPTHFRSNARAVIDAADESFGIWRALAPAAEEQSDERATVTLFVHAGSEGPEPHAPVRYRTLDGRRLLLATPGSQAVVEPLRRDALGWITPALVADRDHFRYGVLDALTYAILSPLERYPLHAAALVRDGRALLLVGPSEVGKSTLSYAAARAGIAVMAEDLVHLQTQPSLRVWGLTAQLNLLGSARRHFPELRNRATSLVANGKEKLTVDLRPLGAVTPTPVVDRVAVCLLARDGASGPPTLEVLDRTQLLSALDPGAETGFDIFRNEMRAGFAQLAARGGWRMSLSPDPNAALPLLERMLESLADGSP